MLGFENLEMNWRKELILEDEPIPNELAEKEEFLQMSLDNPLEVYLFETDIGQKFYTHISELLFNGESFFSVLIASYIDDSPSFVYYRTFTSSQSLLNKFRYGDLVTEDSREVAQQRVAKVEVNPEDFKISEEVLEEVEIKKSMILADLLSKRSEDDIAFEKFFDYDSYLEITLNSPDEIYEFQDDHGDTLYTNIKSFVKDDESFFYIVMTFPYLFQTEKEGKGQLQIPIIGFPSKDKNLYPEYAVGRVMNERLKN